MPWDRIKLTDLEPDTQYNLTHTNFGNPQTCHAQLVI